MSDHLPEDLVRAEQIDDILAGICDEPCAVQDVASGCSCAMARQVVKNLQMTAVNHLGQIERLRAAADGARREAVLWCSGYVLHFPIGGTRMNVVSDISFSLKMLAKDGLPTPPQPDPVAAAGDSSPAYLIRKKGMYYRPGFCGYTPNRDDAGRYSKAEAEAEAAVEPDNTSAVPDPGVSVAAAREAVVRAAMETHQAPPIIGDYQASVQRLFKACAALAALEKGEGL